MAMNRMKPSFFIIGERKCGTSSLFRYLCSHPQILPGRLKESNFFRNSMSYIDKYLDQYYELFPSLDDKEAINHWPELDENGEVFHTDLVFPIKDGVKYQTGEGSANVFSTVDPRKLKKHLPDIKLILILRDPVERAFSHHAMHQRFKKEGRSGFQWVTSLKTSLFFERMVMKFGIDGPYISPGRYVVYLKNWLKYFPLEQFFILEMTDLSSVEKANSILNKLGAFLGIDYHDYSSILSKKFNVSGAGSMHPELALKLGNFYKSYDLELEELLNRKFTWTNGI